MPGGRGAAIATGLLLAGALAGCIGSSGPAALQPADAPSRNPWERGLASHAATPDAAVHRSKAERTAGVAAPGAPQFAAFDAVMSDFMASHQIPAASVAVLRDGKLRYESGYGHLDPNAARATGPDAMFRVASVTKPMTAAVVTMLVDQGRMTWDDPVFCLPPQPAPRCLLPIEPHARRPVQDARVAKVTLRDLVEHRTGWTRWPCTEPFWDGNPIKIAQAFGIPTPPPAWRLAQWFMGTPMDFDPGTDPGPGFDTYCNMGYVVLGLIAEAATGTSIAALYQAYLFEPLEVAGDIEPGHSLPGLRNPREPFYACDGGLTWSVYHPEEKVCWADGGFDLDGILSAGGLIATAGAVGAVYEAFWNDGSARERPGGVTWAGHTGGLPGTATTAERYHTPLGDVQVVVFFDKQGGHELVPLGLSFPYEYQALYAALLGAYADAEGSAPSQVPRDGPAPSATM
jgi:N-acyl-D-amino-acid deacylase